MATNNRVKSWEQMKLLSTLDHGTDGHQDTLTTGQPVWLFWGGYLSQWYPSLFVDKKDYYCCAEQYMMVMKARLFKDKKAEQAILDTAYPATMQEIGRTVRGFDQRIWDTSCYGIVYQATLLKFQQNATLLTKLKATAPCQIVEASPDDSRWGIGLAETDVRALNPKKWKGTNWLGHALTTARDSGSL